VSAAGAGAELPELVETDARFAEVIDALRGQERYALDTEFHRERTYYPQLALVQLAWDGGLVLVDPLVIDVRPLGEILEGPAIGVLHAAGQDLEVLQHAVGARPAHLFDTQIAAGFIGMSSPSLSSLVEHLLGAKVNKGDRLTDWLARPLTDGQRTYAADDVAYLFELHDLLQARLEADGRLQWAYDECERFREGAIGLRDPEEAWRRIKEARALRGQPASVARAVAAWRERRAAEIDQPVRFVLPDLAVVAIAQRKPRTVDDLRRVRGVDGRHLKGPVASTLLDAVQEGVDRPPDTEERPRTEDLDRELRPAVALVSAWVAQLGRDLHLDTTLLATRADLEALLKGDPDARLAHGWRAKIAGDPIRRLVEGEVSLAFQKGGGLVIEERSNIPAGPSSAG
jgi:ribonuclease D